MEIKKVGVVGTGLMGGGIAQVNAQAGYSTVSYDVREDAFPRTQDAIKKSMDKMVSRGKFTREFADAVLGRMEYTTDITKLADCDVIIEAVFENKDVKQNVLKQLEGVVSDKCIIFTNTSGLSITMLSSVMKHPERFMGTHFFAPVPAMKLVELVPGMETSGETYQNACAWAASIGKVTVKAPDTSGFITNRILPIIQNELCELLVQGVDADDIDYCYKLFTKAPIGTMEMIDTGGLDITVGCLTSDYEGLGDEMYRPHYFLRRKLAAGQLGVKTGKGIFDWTKK